LDLFNKKLNARLAEETRIENEKLQKQHAVGKKNDKLLQRRDQKQIEEAFDEYDDDTPRKEIHEYAPSSNKGGGKSNFDGKS
jgi:GTP-binding protein EngB required for normal cell division